MMKETKYKYLGKWPHNLIINDVKYVLRRGKTVKLPKKTKLRKVGKRLSKEIKDKVDELKDKEDEEDEI